MYIANATRQNFRFCFRLPESQKVQVCEIPSGSQAMLGQNWTEGEQQSVLKQLEKFGGREHTEARRGLRNFDSGILYSMDKPVASNEIEYGNEQHLDAAQDRAVKQATLSALAADQANRDKKTKKRKAKKVSVEVAKHGDPRKGEDEPMMNVEISEEGSTSEKLPV